MVPSWTTPADRSRSLALALAAVLRERGGEADVDALGVALGHPFLICAVDGEPDVGLWPMYIRDAFLVEAGRLVGLGLRDVHPPEAAVGLHRAAEFAQHFDASYRPIIERALEHDQPVLAWRGWPGELAHCWGIIRDRCDEGAGFCGTVHVGGSAADDPALMVAPSLQVYVVETCEPRTPPANEIIDLAERNARIALGNQLHDRFGVTTGAPAVDELAARLDSDGQGGAGRPETALRAFIGANLAAAQSARRWFSTAAPSSAKGTGTSAEHLTTFVAHLEEALSNALAAMDEDVATETRRPTELLKPLREFFSRVSYGLPH